MMRNVAAAFAACLVAVPVAAQPTTVLRIGQQEEPDQLDPARGGTFGGRFAFTAMCDKLWDLAPDLSFRPQLATAWKWSDDNRALTITLREGVTLHDGTPMTA